MTTRHRVIAKALIGAALALGLGVAGAAPASADDPDVNPFSGLSCSCHQTPAADGAALLGEIRRGMLQGYAAWAPGLPTVTG